MYTISLKKCFICIYLYSYTWRYLWEKCPESLCAFLLSFSRALYLMVCTECEEWPKEKRSEIMFSFFVSDMHSRKLQQRLNEKLWLVENYFRTHGTWRSNGPSHVAQCSQNPSNFTHIDFGLTTSTYPTSPSSLPWHRDMPTPTTRCLLKQKCMWL